MDLIRNISLFFIALVMIGACRQIDPINYSTQVKPIINNKCIACHGGVKKQGGLSFLFEEEAKAKLKSGKYAIVPGKPHQSEMIRRLGLEDPEMRMPYNHSALPKEEIKVLTEWISQGAVWGEHWAYQSIQKPALPDSKTDWPGNDLDRFVQAKAAAIGLKQAAEASPEVLARRLALDLIGFQGADSVTSTYVQAPTDANYERLVDTLLSSPHYGEKWTSMWLDLARYADTKGYEKDDNRVIWRYRDWLIRAFNADMPYDQFLTEQLAGDLLPNPTEDQYLATAFNRNTMTNDEGGTDNEEFRVAAVIDRVNTTWETLMSTSFACVQCHSHPYDPFRHEDYYKFMAYFNNTRDVDTWADYPIIRHLNEDQQSKLNSLQSTLTKNHTPESQVQEIVHFIKTLQPSVNALESNSFVNCELYDTKWLSMRNPSSARIPHFPLDNHDALIFNYERALKKGLVQFRLDSLQGPIIGSFEVKPSKERVMVEIPLQPIPGIHDIFVTYSSTEYKNPDETCLIFDYFHPTKKFPTDDPKIKKDFWDLVNAPIPNTPIMLDNTPTMFRTTRIFERGNWLAKKDTVHEGLPAIFSSITKNPQNRLELAQWMTSKQHPLTARTIVNRLWEQIWGTGLVETLEDMGSQGATPTHQELLDYLSWKLMNEDGWSLKKLLKEMVMSETYRQDSRLDKNSIELDPTNKFFARGPRVRLSAEQLRDQALAASGVMNAELYGPPAMPYQPEGVWLSPYNGKSWKKSEGNGQYRRAVYTFWKRTSPYPGMSNFDAMGREVCASRRIRTNTPLQALTILNDSAYIQLAMKLVERVGWQNPPENIARAYHLLTGKTIDANKATILKNLYEKSLHIYTQTSDDDAAGKQAMVLIANALMNLDEVITKT
ncbi:MAG: DUF1553 domain-containing protein [Saprospiraceae bacterium]|nr:DUF1553 domain-containing protein [Saprospiraceae bacterium]